MTEAKGQILVEMAPAVGVRGVAAYTIVEMYEKSDAAVEKAMAASA